MTPNEPVEQCAECGERAPGRCRRCNTPLCFYCALWDRHEDKCGQPAGSEEKFYEHFFKSKEEDWKDVLFKYSNWISVGYPKFKTVLQWVC